MEEQHHPFLHFQLCLLLLFFSVVFLADRIEVLLQTLFVRNIRKQIELLVFNRVRQILLLYPVMIIVMRILVADAAVQLRSTVIVRILQIRRNRKITALMYLIHRQFNALRAGI